MVEIFAAAMAYFWTGVGLAVWEKRRVGQADSLVVVVLWPLMVVVFGGLLAVMSLEWAIKRLACRPGEIPPDYRETVVGRLF